MTEDRQTLIQEPRLLADELTSEEIDQVTGGGATGGGAGKVYVQDLCFPSYRATPD